jgi:hypothetical protein
VAVIVSRFSTTGGTKEDESLEDVGIERLMDLQPVRATMLKARNSVVLCFMCGSLEEVDSKSYNL